MAGEGQVIFMEGPDGCGKTTIGKALAEEIGSKYFRMESQHDNWRKNRFKDALEMDQPYLLSLHRQTGYGLVVDRGYISEWAYSQVYGRETNLELIKRLDAEWAELSAVVVICVRDSYETKKKDELVQPHVLPHIDAAYRDIFHKTKLRAILLNVDRTGEDLSKQIKIIKHSLSTPSAFIGSGVKISY